MTRYTWRDRLAELDWPQILIGIASLAACIGSVGWLLFFAVPVGTPA